MQRAQSPSRFARPNLRAMSGKELLEYVKQQKHAAEESAARSRMISADLKAAIDRLTVLVEARNADLF